MPKIKLRYHDRDPLPPTVWRVYVRYLARWMLMGILGLFWLGFLVAVVAAQA